MERRKYVFFWVFPRRLNANNRRFGTLYQFHLPLKMEPIQCSETSAISIQTSGKHPKENILYFTHGESLKSRILSELYTTPRTWADPKIVGKLIHSIGE
jgi:hypothetical protein